MSQAVAAGMRPPPTRVSVAGSSCCAPSHAPCQMLLPGSSPSAIHVVALRPGSSPAAVHVVAAAGMGLWRDNEIWGDPELGEQPSAWEEGVHGNLHG